eukprot:GEMP01037439.1.p1 GENE.GEMP01037439.1~~GEMP01037439.1.p1  ORF type:complete len:433 (+),score=92.21 GEMP01037439.1:92-1390(+)
MVAQASKNPPPIIVVDLRHVRKGIPGYASDNAVRAPRVVRQPEVLKKTYLTSSSDFSASRAVCTHDAYHRPKIPKAVVRSHESGNNASMASWRLPDARYPPEITRVCEEYHGEYRSHPSAPPSIFQRSQAFLERKESKIGKLRADLLKVSRKVSARLPYTPDKRCFFPRQRRIPVVHNAEPRIRRAGYDFSPQRREERFRKRSEFRQKQREEEAAKAKELNELTFRPQLCSPRATGSFLVRQRLWEHAKNAKREVVENICRQQALMEEERVMGKRSEGCLRRTASVMSSRCFYDDNQRWIRHRDAVLEKVREDELKVFEVQRAKRRHSAPCVRSHRGAASFYPMSARGAAMTTAGSRDAWPTTDVPRNSADATTATNPRITTESNPYHSTLRSQLTPDNAVGSSEFTSFTYEDYEETIRHIQILCNHAARNI